MRGKLHVPAHEATDALLAAVLDAGYETGMSGVYDLDQEADRARLQQVLIRRTPAEARLLVALALPSREARIAYRNSVRQRFGEDAARELVEGLKRNQQEREFHE